MRPLLVLLLVLALTPCVVEGVAIGVNRASIDFRDVLRDGFARASLTVTTDSEIPITAEVTLFGPEASWINVSRRNFTFSKDQPYTLHVDAMPPDDAEVTSYRVNMSILTGQLGRSGGGQMGSTTRASLGVPIILSLTGNQIRSCAVSGVTVLDTEQDRPLTVRLNVLNTGNVRIDPEVRIQIYDKYQSSTRAQDAAAFGSRVLPTLAEERDLSFPIDLPVDQYWIGISVPDCNYGGTFTFDVLAPGTIKDDGELIRVDAPSRVATGEIVRVSAVFRNKGDRVVRATFKGTISDADSGVIVKVIDTDEYLIDPQVTADIETFFSPEVQGRYIVAGRVHYNDKLTLEKSTIVNVAGPSILSGDVPWRRVVLAVLLCAIIVLLLLIRRRRAGGRSGWGPARSR